MPHVLNVPGHTAIEWHPGNTEADTHGCTLLGKTKGTDFIGNSREAFNEVIAQMDSSQEMEVEYRENRAT